MDRRGILICTVVCVALAGCLGSGGLGTDTPTTPTDGGLRTDTPTTPTDGGLRTDTPTTPTDDQSSEGTGNGADKCQELESREMPDFPTNVTQRSATSFADRHAKASDWNSLLAGDQVRYAGLTSHAVFLNQTDTGYIVHVGTQFGLTDCEGVHADSRVYNHDYFINQSIVAVRDHEGYISSKDAHNSVSVAEILGNGTVVRRSDESSE